jgi:hypothetical protein
VAAPYAAYGPRQRWLATVDGLRADGWPVASSRPHVRRGELTVPWAAVAPLGPASRELDA